MEPVPPHHGDVLSQFPFRTVHDYNYYAFSVPYLASVGDDEARYVATKTHHHLYPRRLPDEQHQHQYLESIVFRQTNES